MPMPRRVGVGRAYRLSGGLRPARLDEVQRRGEPGGAALEALERQEPLGVRRDGNGTIRAPREGSRRSRRCR